jgi:hypothetical protein
VRLLDHIAQCHEPFVVAQDDGRRWELSGASDFSQSLRSCPLRYVLSDELVRTCIALAYSDGDELSGCLDLLHLPAEQLWIEWDEDARRAELARCLPQPAPAAAPEVLRAGVLLRAEPGGRRGCLRTFWQPREASAEPLLAAVETLIDLDGCAPAPVAGLLEGGSIAVSDPANEQVDSLLRCARFRLDPRWQRYYAAVTTSQPLRQEVTRRSLAAVAYDVPLMLALFLLLSIRDDLVREPVNPQRLNAKRLRLGRQPLLEHLEISAPVFHPPGATRGDGGDGLRRAPRLHHVRGHIVRRADTVYWRGPHWRGHVRLGCVRSRTVALGLPA